VGRSALVIEDDDTIRRLTASLLRRAGFEPIDSACDGIEGLQKLRSGEYCLATLDLRMPRMSGYELLDELKRVPMTNLPKIIVATADRLYREHDLDAELVTGVLTKPYDIDTFMTIVRSCLEEQD
jgi:two-component system chemotaxis response regulator CheY